jgi:hypothetical protein
MPMSDTSDTDPPVRHGSQPDGCALAHIANERSENAERQARACRRELSELKLELAKEANDDLKQGRRVSDDRSWSLRVAIVTALFVALLGAAARIVEAAIRGHW